MCEEKETKNAGILYHSLAYFLPGLCGVMGCEISNRIPDIFGTCEYYIKWSLKLSIM